MRNLRNTRHSELSFPRQGAPLTATAWDAASDSLICAFGPSESSAIIELKHLDNHDYAGDAAKLIASWDAPCPLPDLTTDKILSLQYFSDTATICLILAGGDLIVVKEQPLPGEDLIEIVGTVDAGVTAAAWSPDEEVVAISTRANTLIFMTRDFESLANVALSPEDVKISAHVSVGWGKTETQFKGKRAKALRDPTVPEYTDEGKLSSLDRGETTITWRGDGAYLAVNRVEESQHRMIRVFSREGVLDAVSEPVDGLEGALSWRPAGNLMAGIQRLSDRIDVVFFERNGLRHGEFPLRLSQEEMLDWASVISVRWNSDSTVLAVSFKDRVQLWTMGNYHYYLKQEITFLATHDPLEVVWHPEKSLHLAILSDHSLKILHYVFAISASSTISPNDLGLVAVIDGRVLKLTPLRVANVPPPMALADIQLLDNAIDVCINKSCTEVAVLNTTSISVFYCHFRSTPPQPPHASGAYTLASHTPRQLAFKGDKELSVLYSDVDSASDRLSHFSTDDLRILEAHDVSTSIRSLFSPMDHEKTCCEDNEGVVYDIAQPPKGPVSLELLTKFPIPCQNVKIWQDEGHTIIFGLSQGGVLYGVNITGPDNPSQERLQVRNCTSFLVTPAHLIYTTSQHLLKFVHLHTGDLEVPLDEPEKDERCRSIERGARLVTVMPTANSLTLQMPRGNLETIYPRALVLAGIRTSIAAKKYKRAFFACRNHRVDMNILHDYAPMQFMASVDVFVDQVKRKEHIDLFLSQLREDDVAETLYKETLNAPKLGLHGDIPNGTELGDLAKPSMSSTSKINRICDGFLHVLEAQRSKYLQNIVTAHVCKSPPDLEAGLLLVAQLREKEADMAEKAVEHICFLADVNRLYDTALGLYDIDVALLVAQQSQKDPREYLPYLQGLQKLPETRRKFTIDHDLKRHGKALTHLFALDVFEELKSYTAAHELHSQAINLYRYQTARLNELMKIYADFLSNRNRFKESAIAYEYLGDYSAACDAYRAASMWRECLSSASLASLPEEELRSLSEALAEGLVESKDHFAAATIYLDYLMDVEVAVRTFCKGYFYAEALRVIGLRGRRDLIEAVVDAGLVDGSATMTELLADMKTQLGAQVPRLRELRLKKAEDPLAFFEGTAGDGVDIPDNVSLAPTDATTSAGTFMTRYTNRSTGTLASNATRKTSKNRRREERKRARGKKGSVYEEEYLVNSIGRLIERGNSVSEEVARLVEGLMRRAMRERAVAVENAMDNVIGMCKTCLAEVFQIETKAADSEKAVDGDESGRPAGGEGVLWDAMEGAQNKMEPPIIKDFNRLSLLG